MSLPGITSKLIVAPARPTNSPFARSRAKTRRSSKTTSFQRNPRGFYGTYIITISAHSENLSEFDGGDGRVALHGTNQPGLLGQAVSHGCVRLDNGVATRLGRNVPPGAPVDIVN